MYHEFKWYVYGNQRNKIKINVGRDAKVKWSRVWFLDVNVTLYNTSVLT